MDRSPDLNPIEHLWDYLGREVAALNPPPRSLHELKQGLLCVWSSLPIPVSDNLINSMGNRCRQCIQIDSFVKLKSFTDVSSERIVKGKILVLDLSALCIRDLDIEETLGNFREKYLGGIQVIVDGSCRRSNLEIYKILKQPDNIKFVKLQRLKWAGHLAVMNEDRWCKKIFLGKSP
ncbi:transposable element Tcb2 transposase [Trichonephila clavipes]|nr:transposable element Tcb2 transposase [Trichonephila clavipes]